MKLITLALFLSLFATAVRSEPPEREEVAQVRIDSLTLFEPAPGTLFRQGHTYFIQYQNSNFSVSDAIATEIQRLKATGVVPIVSTDGGTYTVYPSLTAARVARCILLSGAMAEAPTEFRRRGR